MPSEYPSSKRLHLLVQRLLDSEAVTGEHAESLLLEAESAQQARENGADSISCLHVQRVALFTEALLKTQALSEAEAKAILEEAAAILQSANKKSRSA